jgi:hypothetical protein
MAQTPRLIKSLALRVPQLKYLYTEMARLQQENENLSRKNAELEETRVALHNEKLEMSEQVSTAQQVSLTQTTEANRLREQLLVSEQISEIQKREATSLREQIAGTSGLEAKNLQLQTQVESLQEYVESLQLQMQHEKEYSQRGLTTFQEETNAELKNINAKLMGLISIEESDTQLGLVRAERSNKADKAEDNENESAGTTAWLNLLEAVLTGRVTEDESIDPWSEENYDPSKRLIGRDWPKTALTMIGTARMRNLRVLCERVLSEDVPGDMLEAGVWRGGACIYMKAIIQAYANTTRRVYVADSFEGLPTPDVNRYPADANDRHYEFDSLQVDRASVEAGFRKFGLLDENVVFLEGWFKDTLPNAPIENLSILRLDGDMYESTQQTLQALYKKVSPGGYVIVDDYILKPCAQAVDDYREANNITAPLQKVDGSAVWWQVE